MLYSHNQIQANTNASGLKYTGENKYTGRTQVDTNTGGLHCSATNVLFITWLRFFDKRRETILKSLSYHRMLTTPQRSVHVVDQSQFLNIMVGPNFSIPSWSDPNFNGLPLRQTTQLSAYIVHNQLPTNSFSKSSNYQDNRFRAWRHSHSRYLSLPPTRHDLTQGQKPEGWLKWG